MAIVKPTSTVIRTDYDNTDTILKQVQLVSFDLRDLVALVEEQNNKGLAGSQLLVPPARLRHLCEMSDGNFGSHHHHHGSSHQQGGTPAWKAQGNVAFKNLAAEVDAAAASSSSSSGKGFDASSSSGGKKSRANTFAQALWDRGVHLFRLLRHLGRPIHGLPVLDITPGSLLSKIDSYNTEIELLLLRSRSGKTGDDELCFQFVRGQCPRGASCSFAHSKQAVTGWAQRWASEHMRDYTDANYLRAQAGLLMLSGDSHTDSPKNVRRNLAAAGGGGGRRGTQRPIAAVTAAARGGGGGSADSSPAAQQQQPAAPAPAAPLFLERPFSRGAMLKFAEAVGPEALSVILDLIKQRDEIVLRSGTDRESTLRSIIVRSSFARPSFDVFCSMIEMNMYPSLSALDLSKCELHGVGMHRMGKLGKVLRRAMKEPRLGCDSNSSISSMDISQRQHHQQQAGGGGNNSNRHNIITSRNKFIICLGNNGLQNLNASQFLSAFVSAGASSSLHGNNKNDAAMGGDNNPDSNLNASMTLGNQQQGGGGIRKNLNASDIFVSHDLSIMSSGAIAAVASGSASAGAFSPSASRALDVFSPHNASGVALVPPAAAAAAAAAAGASGAQLQQVPIQLPENYPLLSVNLEFNNIGPSVPDFSDFIAGLTDCLPFIHKLSLAGNPLQHDGAARLFQMWRRSLVQYLDLSGCGLGDRGVNMVCDAIKAPGNAPVKYLNLGWNGITADGISFLGELLRQRECELSCLRLDYNPSLGRRGSIILSQALKENTSLRRLDLRWCYIADEGALALLDALGHSRNTSLAVLRFDKFEVDPRTIEALQERLKPVVGHCTDELERMNVDHVW